MAVAKEDFLFTLRSIYMREVLCRDIVRESLAKRKNVHPSGRIVLLDRSCAWKEALIKEEKIMGIQGEVLFVLFRSSDKEGFRVSTVPVEPRSFDFRLGLCAEWRGKGTEQLRAESGIADMVFCHHSGFIGGALSFESALKMAVLSMQSAPKAPVKAAVPSE